MDKLNKYDIRKAHKALYTAFTTEFSVINVPTLQFIAIDGHGDPNTSQSYSDAVEALYSVAYALKFDSKKNLERDFAVGPLEGTWRADDLTAFATRDKNAWSWTMMISQPEWITQALFEAAVETNSAKRNLPALPLVKLIELSEGAAVHIMHIGPYDDEGPILDKLHHEYLPANGLVPTLDHHEIYLSDPRRTAPEKLKTILRQPVAPKPT
ncbi:MAG: GyrI-like domain-containing protein [Terrimesophilobacter sp.]